MIISGGLALEVRSRRLGFAVFQGSDLLEWGARRYASGVVRTVAAIEKVRFFLKLYVPLVVIVRQTRRVRDKFLENRSACTAQDWNGAATSVCSVGGREPTRCWTLLRPVWLSNKNMTSLGCLQINSQS